jgi:membrane protein YdbS with pleckstrin-like domain
VTGSPGDQPQTVDAVFAPPGEPWRRVSPRLATARRIGLAATLGVLLVAAVVALVVLDAPGWTYGVALVVAVVLGVWVSWLIGRRVRAYGYAERADDLLVTSGLLLRRLVIVPYGRMQLVDVVAGPLERALGIATLQLHTAAATTDATIPGLPPDEAAALRDRLAARGEERSAGL